MLPGTQRHIQTQNVLSIVWLLTCGTHPLDDSEGIFGEGGIDGKYETIWVDIILASK